MVSVCFYFQVHQPLRTGRYQVFDIGKKDDYFDNPKNEEVIKRVVEKCYMPANKMMSNLIKEFPGFKVSYSFSGIVLEQLGKYSPEALVSFAELIDTGNVEVLSETYHHSLASLYSKDEFVNQVGMHKRVIKKIFNVEPKIFRNTELIYNNNIVKYAEDMGYKATLAEGADHILDWRSPAFVYKAKDSALKILLRHYKLSDDISFRFSSQDWAEWPLKSEKFAHWISSVNGSGQCINLFMDYETLGEHQWKETGIFEFFQNLPREIYKHPDNNFMTPSEVVKTYKPVAELDVPNTVSWADIERDTSAWTGNDMQRAALNYLYHLQDDVLKTQHSALIEQWRKLQTSDHFYYMCTKWFNDGDVHKYFNPYNSPYEAFLSFMNIINDLKIKIKEVNSMPKVTHDIAARILAGTQGETCFWCCDGKILASLEDLSKALKKMPGKTFRHHVHKGKNDFSSWIHDILGDAELAKSISAVRNKSVMAKRIDSRIAQLRRMYK